MPEDSTSQRRDTPSSVETSARQFDLASARAAADEDRLAEWVGDFLASPGSGNATLAAGLAQREHWWMGPIRVPLDRLTRLAGPEPSIECTIEPVVWESEVDAMGDELDDGWEPPPLLAQWSRADGALLLQDGNHRYEALVREGATDAWVIVYFEDPRERALFDATCVVVRPSRGPWRGGRTQRLIHAVAQRLGVRRGRTG
jgi:hypothetical protein